VISVSCASIHAVGRVMMERTSLMRPCADVKAAWHSAMKRPDGPYRGIVPPVLEDRMTRRDDRATR
jgi:hypothetical protein